MKDSILKFDDSHISKHFREQNYDHAITQKGYIDKSTFQSWTDIDMATEKVGASGLSNFYTQDY